MRLTHFVLAAAAVLASRTADAGSTCADPDSPEAALLAGNKRENTGRQPWIDLWNVKDADTVTLSIVNPKGNKPVEIERKGQYVRAKQPLPLGAKVQLALGTKVLTHFTVRPDDKTATELPAWNGIKVRSKSMQGPAGCATKGPAVWLTVNKTEAKLDGAMLIVFTKKPDAADPVKDLGTIASFGGADEKGVIHVQLRNYSHHANFLPVSSIPPKLWVALTDQEGHLGPVLELKVK